MRGEYVGIGINQPQINFCVAIINLIHFFSMHYIKVIYYVHIVFIVREQSDCA